MHEIEIKLAHEGPFELPDFSGGDGGFAAVKALEPLRLRATYYDTPDLRLARSGITLRWRTGEGDAPRWTLKLPVQGTDGVVRKELHFESTTKSAPKRVPEGPSELLIALVRSEALSAVARIHTARRRWVLLDDDGVELAEIAEDVVSVSRGRGPAETWREIEVEARALDRAGLKLVVDRLVAAGGKEPGTTPKLVRALGVAAAGPPEPDVPEHVDPAGPASAAVALALAAGFRRLVGNDPATRLGEVEPVHQMRVATRRLRSDLRTFRALVDERWAAPLVEDLRWLGGLLGNVRDVDVLGELLYESSEGLRDDLAPLFETLADRRETEHAVLMDALRSSRYLGFLERLLEAAAEPDVTADAARPSQEVLPPLVRKAWRKLARTARAVDAQASDEELHGVRILAKRARYAAEAVAPALGEARGRAARDFAKRATKVQDVLGALQDTAMARATIEPLATRRSADGSVLVAAGRLLERQERLATEARAGFSQAWGKLDRKSTRRWMKA
jgi:CHAD domain-containing protein